MLRLSQGRKRLEETRTSRNCPKCYQHPERLKTQITNQLANNDTSKRKNYNMGHWPSFDLAYEVFFLPLRPTQQAKKRLRPLFSHIDWTSEVKLTIHYKGCGVRKFKEPKGFWPWNLGCQALNGKGSGTFLQTHKENVFGLWQSSFSRAQPCTLQYIVEKMFSGH